MQPNCQVCGQRANGNHYGVLSCRSCAAFFRRYAKNPKRHEEAAISHGQCNKNGNQSRLFNCKKCRLRMCLESGMDASKVQLNRDLTSSTLSDRPNSSKMHRSLNNFIGRPVFLYFCDPGAVEAAGKIRNIVNFDFLIARASTIMRNGSGKPYSPNLNSLEKMSFSFESSSSVQQTLPKYIGYLEKNNFMQYWEQEFLKTAEWLTLFQEFNAAPLDIRLTIVNNVWTMWGRFEKLAKTAYFREKKVLNSENMFMIGENQYIDIQETDIDVSWFSDYEKEQIAYLMHSYHNENFNKIIDLLMELNPTSEELTYMILELCLQQAGKRIAGNVAELTDRLQETISNQLHSYYQKKRNWNYAGRVTKMMKVNNLMRKDLWEKKEKKQIADLFHVFTLDFSHPEMLF